MKEVYILPMCKLTSLDIEVAVATLFKPRYNIIVPNVWWGMGFNYELDIIILTKANCTTEVEIKISIQDLKADFNKRFIHNSLMINKFYYAIPDTLLEKALSIIPVESGIITVDSKRVAKIYRKSKTKNKYRFTDKQRVKLLELCAMRVWTLKKKLQSSLSYPVFPDK